MSKYKRGMSHQGAVLEDQDKNQPLVMVNNTTNYIFISGRKCEELKSPVEVIIFRDGHGLNDMPNKEQTFSYLNAATNFVTFVLRKYYVDASPAFTLSTAIDAFYLSSTSHQNQLRCKLHYIARRSTEDAVTVRHVDSKWTAHGFELKLNIVTENCHHGESFQIFSLC